jgi:diguanylate cyclase (GGDEF)-like protein
MIAAAGGLLSVLFTALTWQLLSGRERALRLARAMTRDLRESEARFRYLAQYDELSGLPNRAMFRDRLQHAIVQARRDKTRLALMYLDLDKFKPVNDQLGHHVGDMLLRAVAETMLSCVRESDTVARIGGDEFVILLPVIEQDYDALRVAEKIRYALSQPFQVAGSHVLLVSASIGVAVYPDHGNNEIELSKNADNAMYQAKDRGRNQVCIFSPDGVLPPAS